MIPNKIGVPVTSVLVLLLLVLYISGEWRGFLVMQF